MKKIVIIPGGFHPFHAGHASLYKDAVKAFPDADVYVAATNDTSSRPFPFAVKEKLAQLAGVAPGRFVQVKSPFGAEEITSKYDPNTTNLIFVKSTKNAKGGPSPEGPFPAEIDPATGKLPLVTRGANKGKPVSDRLQYYRKGMKMQPMSRHSYLAYLPTTEFGGGMTSGSEIRAEWPTLDDQGKIDRVMSLYPRTQTNPKLAQTVVKLLDVAIGGQGVTEGSNDSAEKYKAHLLKTAPQVMDFLAKSVKGWRPSEQEMLGAIDTAYTVMKHTGDVKQAGKAMMDELNTLHQMSQGQQGVEEAMNQQLAMGGMRASYQNKDNQPIDENPDYVEERRL
jgi:hypothetical protein